MSELERAGDQLAELFERLGFGKPAHLTRVVSEWEDIVGPIWSNRTEPVGLEAGELTVEVESGLDATRFRYEEKALVDRLSERLGEGVVKAIRVRVGRRKRFR